MAGISRKSDPIPPARHRLPDYNAAMLQAFCHAVLFVALAVACVTDLRRREIPDSCSVAILAAFGAVAVAAPIGWVGLVSALTAGLAAFGVGAFLFHRGLMGGGDVKLLGAVAVWAGWTLLPHLLLWMALAGGILTLLCLAARRIDRPWAQLLAPDRGIPYGIAIAAGALVV